MQCMGSGPFHLNGDHFYGWLTPKFARFRSASAREFPDNKRAGPTYVDLAAGRSLQKVGLLYFLPEGRLQLCTLMLQSARRYSKDI